MPLSYRVPRICTRKRFYFQEHSLGIATAARTNIVTLEYYNMYSTVCLDDINWIILVFVVALEICYSSSQP
jgi:hypothetical protein